MAGRFTLFESPSNVVGHELHDKANSQLLSTMKPKTFSTNDNRASNSDSKSTIKPKGLSIRSQSDVNITSNVQPSRGKYLTMPKSTLKVQDNLSCLNPRNSQKLAKMMVISEKRKGPLYSPHSPQTIFKRPITPRRIPKPMKNTREPEKLAHDWNPNDDDCFKEIFLDKEIKDFIDSQKRPAEFLDEGFVSDPEELPDPVSPVCIPCLNFEHDVVDIPELPTISDDDDDDY